MADNNDMFMDSVPEGAQDAMGAAPSEPAENAVPAGAEQVNTQTYSGPDMSGQTIPQPQAQDAPAQSQDPVYSNAGANKNPSAQASYSQAPTGNYAPNNSANRTAASGSASAPNTAPLKEKKKFSLKEWIPGPQVPNQLTMLRICMIPIFVVLILWVPKPLGNILAMITFCLASLTDAADGYIARRYNYVSTFGKFMDPLADKLLVCSALICLVDLGRIESWIVIIIIAREFIISGFRLIAVEKGVVIAANIWGKLKTIAQMLMVILMVGNFGGFLGLVAEFLKWIALALTLISLVTYMFKNRRVLEDHV